MSAADHPASLDERLAALPRTPGVYRFRSAAGEVLYVGKAKALRQRVRSYFQPGAQHPPRIANLVAEVADFDVIVVGSELEALILESNLIKRERPRYNVVLRDDKSFPYLKLSLEDEYPRASLVRRARLDRNVYVGPFLPAATAWRSLKIVQRQFRVATCKEIFDGQRRPCLYYHLDQCLAPCAGRTNPVEYGQAVADARLFLEGRHRDLETRLAERMAEASASQDYEAAARHRDTLRTVEALAVRQSMASVGLEEQDYLAHHAAGGQVALQLFQMREGRISARREFTLDGVDLTPAALYATVISQAYAEVEPPPELYLDVLPDDAELLAEWLTQRRGGRVRLLVPQRGDKRRLLDLVRSNAALAFEARFRTGHRHGVEVLEALAELLGLEEPPFRIECFDVSNLQGSDIVAALVVWEGGRPRKSDYRSFTIRGLAGPDDFASMAQAVTRRYSRLVAEGRRLPDLVLIDGGRGQLGAAVAALAGVGLPMIPVLSIAKREEELFLEGRAEPLRLARNSPVLQFIQRIRDEAHRFAVGRHRAKRSRRTLRSELLDIPGIGPAMTRRLLRAFGSLEGVRQAGAEDWQRVAGRRVAAALVERFGQNAPGDGLS